ncbi:hypothetical protein BJ138DRAFT_1228806 [Hygrophoropsis aurantiaca]|uniref:Uncharacterized protein n=1 Tax=Hygrophoropsis aurantiaca TaxID=72124 RepID=A0ACB7ZXT5_9AGAM|nr:hypothetical protein BJ138DRAFT_1228806 [Hygrophoropsis aurantiaca]
MSGDDVLGEVLVDSLVQVAIAVGRSSASFLITIHPRGQRPPPPLRINSTSETRGPREEPTMQRWRTRANYCARTILPSSKSQASQSQIPNFPIPTTILPLPQPPSKPSATRPYIGVCQSPDALSHSHRARSDPNLSCHRCRVLAAHDGLGNEVRGYTSSLGAAVFVSAPRLCQCRVRMPSHYSQVTASDGLAPIPRSGHDPDLPCPRMVLKPVARMVLKPVARMVLNPVMRMPPNPVTRMLFKPATRMGTFSRSDIPPE